MGIELTDIAATVEGEFDARGVKDGLGESSHPVLPRQDGALWGDGRAGGEAERRVPGSLPHLYDLVSLGTHRDRERNGISCLSCHGSLDRALGDSGQETLTTIETLSHQEVQYGWNRWIVLAE